MLVFRVADFYHTFRDKQMTISRIAGWHHAIEHINSTTNRFYNVFRLTHAHQVTRFIFRNFWCSVIDNADHVLENMGLNGRQGEHVVVVENTETTHNLVVCTLCSCYPWPLLGLPPNWYKSDAYRSRAVREPRAVLNDFNVKLSSSKKVQVWDSTSEIRYLVLPQQPDSSKGLSENKLVSWVTRDSMIGTGFPKSPKGK